VVLRFKVVLGRREHSYPPQLTPVVVEALQEVVILKPLAEAAVDTTEAAALIGGMAVVVVVVVEAADQDLCTPLM
jgi:hypothetical protein